MDFNEIKEAKGLGLGEFKAFIQKKLNADKKYLEQSFWVADGSQLTVLNYLIQEHQENDLPNFIEDTIKLALDKNIGEPLHQAIAAGKIQLALKLLNDVNYYNALDVNRRDAEGRTLLSLALNARNVDLLQFILAKHPNVNASTFMSEARVPFQPLHQAVVLDFADGITLLAADGAQLANPFGSMADTPILLAARLNKMNSLDALLKLPVEKLLLEATNNNLFQDKQTGHTAVEELCVRIKSNDKIDEAIKGIAMLLCCGALPPRNEDMRKLLSSHRIVLLKAVDDYLKNNPKLVDAFVNRCHLKEGELHNIMYANHSWGSSIRHLFGKPSDAAFIIEGLVTNKYTKEQTDLPSLPVAAAERLSGKEDPLMLYAEFVKRYTETYNSQQITNRWSTMRWMIAEGQCDWATVVRYAKSHPASRTKLIYKDMFGPAPEIHDDMDKILINPRSEHSINRSQ